MKYPKYVCMDGEIVPWEQGTVHIMTPMFRYAAEVFEGLRGYWNDDAEELYVFRVKEHFERLRASMKIMRFDGDYDPDYLTRCMIDLIRANELREDTYVRPAVYIGGDGEMNAPGPVHFSIVAHAKGGMVKESGGLDCSVSSWSRISDQANPPRVKCIANYYNGRLAYMQANADGYDSTIILNVDGKVAEAPGACLFLIRDGKPVTPAVTQGILEGITRATVSTLLEEDMGLATEAREIDRTELYLADELFLCGTGYQILPIVSVDRLKIGSGDTGPITAALGEKYTAIARGLIPDHAEWRTPVWA